jgi:hypothetical protein
VCRGAALQRTLSRRAPPAVPCILFPYRPQSVVGESATLALNSPANEAAAHIPSPTALSIFDCFRSTTQPLDTWPCLASVAQASTKENKNLHCPGCSGRASESSRFSPNRRSPRV